MIGEVDIHGVLVVPLLVWLLVAYALSIPLRRLLALGGVYRWVWHRALFDAALLALLTGAVDALANHWTNP